MKNKNRILFTITFAALSLSSCTNVVNDYSNIVNEIGEENCKIICNSFFKRIDDGKVKNVNTKLLNHFGFLNDAYSIDYIYSFSEGYCYSASFYKGVAGGKYICNISPEYYLNLCDLNQKKSYSISNAYDNKIINDSDIKQIIDWTYSAGLRETNEDIDIEELHFCTNV